MTPDQIAAVRPSWPAIAAQTDVLTTHFYAVLFEIDESAARLFAGVDMTAQRTKLAQSLAVIVSALDDPERLVSALAALGKRHTRYGVRHAHFGSVGEALLRAIGTTLGEACTAAVREAWGEAYAFVAAVMQRAVVRAEGASIAEPLHRDARTLTG